MATASLLTLIDDIVLILDDCWIMTQLSAKKTAGILGDDLALNAEQMVGFHPERELPVIFAVAKGSVRNKAILVPAALGLQAAAPWLISPLLIVGGVFLCFEGVEKLLHRGSPASPSLAPVQLHTPEVEAQRIQGAIRTDFILSAEIVAITLGTVANSTWLHALVVLVLISLLMTVGVYGIVAFIVKLDDMGLSLLKSDSPRRQRVGQWILRLAPRLLQGLSWLGTVAIFSVGGGIIVHGLPFLHHLAQAIANPLLGLLFEALAGVLSGALVAGVVHLVRGKKH